MILAALARGLVRFRWLVIAFWVAVAVVAFVQAPKTPERLALKGGSDEPSEARVADQMLATRFSEPFGDFFAVTLEGPSSFRSGPSRSVLDSLSIERSTCRL